MTPRYMRRVHDDTVWMLPAPLYSSSCLSDCLNLIIKLLQHTVLRPSNIPAEARAQHDVCRPHKKHSVSIIGLLEDRLASKNMSMDGDLHIIDASAVQSGAELWHACSTTGCQCSAVQRKKLRRSYS